MNQDIISINDLIIDADFGPELRVYRESFLERVKDNLQDVIDAINNELAYRQGEKVEAKTASYILKQGKKDVDFVPLAVDQGCDCDSCNELRETEKQQKARKAANNIESEYYNEDAANQEVEEEE